MGKTVALRVVASAAMRSTSASEASPADLSPQPLSDIKGSVRFVCLYSQLDFHRGASVEQQGRRYDGKVLTPVFEATQPFDLGQVYPVSDVREALRNINKGHPAQNCPLTAKLIEGAKTCNMIVLDENGCPGPYDAVGSYGYKETAETVWPSET